MKSKKKPFISIVIPVERQTSYLNEALACYDKQTYSEFEVIISSTILFSVPYSFARVVVDRKLVGDVSAKRNKILKLGKGEIFVFNDDDVFVPKQYLTKIIQKMKDFRTVGVCGPLLTPLKDSFWQQGSGAVWESYLGSFGAGVYRSRKMSARIVYDYPAANLIVRREVFKSIGGFEPGIYPGEDTKLCLLIYDKYQQGINYDPELFAYHHRKPLFRDHLTQIGRYGNQRGWFSLSYPSTSFKLQYFVPTLLLFYLFGLVILLFSNLKIVIPGFIYLPLFLYLILVMLEGMIIVIRKNFKIAMITMIGIIATHLYYGYRFLMSFINKINQKLFNTSIV